ncbi:MAG: DUF3800 domain-containing protein [Amylibacter sp.]|nr:DUF3800 domain-containing protein [Amylibacter sp.]
MFRLYLDEVGTDVLTHVDHENHRFLSLSGVVLNKTANRDILVPQFSLLKANVFDHDPDEPLIFHRKDIAQFKGPFWVLKDLQKRAEFDDFIINLFSELDFKIITVLIDKQWMLRQEHWNSQHPYHYLMEVMVEKYAQLLERCDSIGDIMPEARQGKPDRKLQATFETVRQAGTRYCNSERICFRIPSKNLKFRTKKDNISGLQLCDLLAHPSHFNIRELEGHDVNVGAFARRLIEIMNVNKYDRSIYGRIRGYGTKYFG